jgi:hypothetical protein|tara:strand:- start:26 stop:313 length:288 start_codon:yes stop_codon:yes gene_type:complete
MSGMSQLHADTKLALLKHLTEFLLIFSTDEEELSDAEIHLQYNDAEEMADLLMESLSLKIIDVGEDGTITTTSNPQELEAFIDAKADEYLVAEEL